MVAKASGLNVISELTVVGLYLTDSEESLVTEARHKLKFALQGVDGERRHPPGFIRRADGRDKLVPRGTKVCEWRSWSAVSLEELQMIAFRLDIPQEDAAKLAPLVGANILFDCAGATNFTQLANGSHIVFPQPQGAILWVMAENEPCTQPGEAIAAVYPHVKANLFPKAAKGLRGLVGVVYKAGVVTINDTARVTLPY